MLTTLSEERIRGAMTLLLDAPQEQVGSSSLLVLRLVGDLADTFGEPVLLESLVWVADVADRREDPDEALSALDKALGPRPRRDPLFSVIGILVDHGFLASSPEGLRMTERGTEVLADPRAAWAPSFASVIKR
jgi:hypothetical protein